MTIEVNAVQLAVGIALLGFAGAVLGAAAGAAVAGRYAREVAEKEIASREKVVFHPDRYRAFLPLMKQCTALMMAQMGNRPTELSDFDLYEERAAVVMLIGSVETAGALVKFTNSLPKVGPGGVSIATKQQKTVIAEAYEELRDCLRSDLGGDPIAPVAHAMETAIREARDE